MEAFSWHNCKEFKYYECCEDEVWNIDPVSETEAKLFFVSMVDLLPWKQMLNYLIM